MVVVLDILLDSLVGYLISHPLELIMDITQHLVGLSQGALEHLMALDTVDIPSVVVDPCLVVADPCLVVAVPSPAVVDHCLEVLQVLLVVISLAMDHTIILTLSTSLVVIVLVVKCPRSGNQWIQVHQHPCSTIDGQGRHRRQI